MLTLKPTISLSESGEVLDGKRLSHSLFSKITFLASLIQKKKKTQTSRHHNVYPPLQLVIRLQDLRVINDEQPCKRRDAPHSVGGLTHVSARIGIPQFLYGQLAALRPVTVGHETRIVQLHAVPIPLHPWHWVTSDLQHCLVGITKELKGASYDSQDGRAASERARNGGRLIQLSQFLSY